MTNFSPTAFTVRRQGRQCDVPDVPSPTPLGRDTYKERLERAEWGEHGWRSSAADRKIFVVSTYHVCVDRQSLESTLSISRIYDPSEPTYGDRYA